MGLSISPDYYDKDAFLESLAEAVENNGTAEIPDPDHPRCPACGATMQFHGGDLEFGQGY